MARVGDLDSVVGIVSNSAGSTLCQERVARLIGEELLHNRRRGLDAAIMLEYWADKAVDKLTESRVDPKRSARLYKPPHHMWDRGRASRWGRS